MKRKPGKAPQGADSTTAGMSRRFAMALGVGGALAAANGTKISQAAPEVFVQDLNGGSRGTVMFVPGWTLPSATHGMYIDEPTKFDDELLRFVES